MRIKNFTLLTLALFVMSVVAFAQKPNSTQRVLTSKQQLQYAIRTGQLTKENASAFTFAKPALPQITQKAKANRPVLPAALQAPQKAEAAAYTYGFSQGMNGWTVIDADGDGNTWYLSISTSASGHDGQPGLMTSASYASTALNPDNYLVSPKMKLDGKITFYACAQDASYAAEHFGVAVSTAGGTNPEDFTMVQEWDMTAAPSLAPSANFNASAGAFRSPRRVQGNWYLYEVDLSSYAGAEGYVAIRHYNCTDMFRLNVDDITLETSLLIDAYDPTLETAPEKPEVVTPPAGLVTEDWTISRYFCNSQGDTPDERVLKVGFDGSDVYIQGFSYYQEDAWIKGSLSADGKSITFASGQYYGAYGDEYDMWFAGWEYPNDLAPVIVTYDAEAGTMTWPGLDEIVILENAAADEASYYGYFADITMVKGTGPDLLPAPDIITSEWLFKSQSISEDADSGESVATEYNLHVQVGVGPTEIFVQGLSEDAPEGWVKGTLDPATNKVTFPTGQYLGFYYVLDWNTWSYVPVKVYLAGYGENGMEDIVMDYDAAAKTLTMESPTYMLINEAWLLPSPTKVLTDVQLQEIADVAAIPAQPTITKASLTGSYPYITIDVPDTDVDGNPLLVGKLSYQYFTDVNKTITPLTLSTSDYSKLSVDMTEIPYTFTDDYDIFNNGLYLNQDFSTWNKIGIQSIYRGGGEEHKSEIFWYTIVPYSHQLTLVAANDLSIQNKNATVTVNGKKADVDAEGKLNVPETYTVTIKAAKGYRFVSASSTDATVTVADDLFSATFEMPTTDATINYELREMGGDIIFATEGEYTIQDGLASVLVDDADVTKNIDADGKLIDIAEGATVTINAAQGYKLASVEATYTPKASGGSGSASEIEIGSAEATNNYVPTYSLYNYSLTQQIYTAAEIGQAGQINSISFFNANKEKTRNIDLYLVHTTKSTFDGSNDWIAVSASDKVFGGEVTFTAEGDWTTITLDTPFSYNGTDNLAVIVDDNTGNWESGLSCNVFDAANQTLRIYNDNDNYDPTNPASYNGAVMSVKNNIKLGFAGGSAPTPVGVDVALAKKGNTASFIMPGRGQVNVTYVIERLGYPIEVPADAYITYYTDKDILIYDTDCELMTVTGLNGNEVTVTPLNVVAANTPMLIHNSGAEKELWIVPAEETADAPAADEVTVLPAFKGTLTGETFSDADMAAKDYYGCNGYSFAWVRSAGSIAANKCWLEFEKDASPKVPSLAIGFGGGETTGINTVNGKMESDGQYYDLNGRKLNAAPTQKGVYIINGKKAVIK